MRGHITAGRGRALAVAALAGTLALAAALMAFAVYQTAPGPGPVACHAALGVRLVPSDTAIAVGASFAPTAWLSTCAEGWSATADTFAWAAADPAVARVDAATGRTTGRAPGATNVAATGRRFGRVGAVRVVVRAAP